MSGRVENDTWEGDCSSGSSDTEMSDSGTPITPVQTPRTRPQPVQYHEWLSYSEKDSKDEDDDWFAAPEELTIRERIDMWDKEDDDYGYYSDYYEDEDSYPPLSPSAHWSPQPFFLVPIEEEWDDSAREEHSGDDDWRGAVEHCEAVEDATSGECGSETTQAHWYEGYTLVGEEWPVWFGCEAGDKAAAGRYEQAIQQAISRHPFQGQGQLLMQPMCPEWGPAVHTSA